MNRNFADRSVLVGQGPTVPLGKEPAAPRTVIVASADVALRGRLRHALSELRWQVREASGGADALHQMDHARPEALLLDSWLPDLEVEEVASQVRALYPTIDLLRVDGGSEAGGTRSPRRHELMHALREAQQDSQPAAYSPGAASPGLHRAGSTLPNAENRREEGALPSPLLSSPLPSSPMLSQSVPPSSVLTDELTRRAPAVAAGRGDHAVIAELIGRTPVMLELSRLIRLVAPRSATVLIEGETGTGKEVVAKALHRLSSRASKSFMVLNCAAIPEALLEAELFGHTRGAFTGADKARTGRIEAANGGTLFLDEIGEMPLALQAKMLRFLEAGELQRVGDNETMRVDVRVIAATHQPLEQRSEERTFRLDLYHRLAVFPLDVPSLRERADDIPLLVEHFLDQMGRELPRKRISAEALAKLTGFHWPGNVRELMHVIERGTILAGNRPEIGIEEIRLRRNQRA